MPPRTVRTSAPLAAAVLGVLLAAASARAQEVNVPDADPRVRAALEHVVRAEPSVIEEQIEICQIEAPPFKEAQRAEDYRRRMEEIGLQNVRIDAEGNVLGERPGEPGEPVVVLSGHLDTVFPEGTDVTVRREGTVLHGPGIGDDCRGLAVVLAVARTLDEARIPTRGTLIFVGTVGEEGPGNLRGVRHLFETELRDRVDYFISIDGTGLDMVKDAVGSYRYRIVYTGPGGHSYGRFGVPNPVHALGRAIAHVADFEVPTQPRVTFSVGIVDGGTSVNAIAESATMQVDMRSVDPAALDALDARFLEAVHRALAEENARWAESGVALEVEVERWGNRPAGTQPADAYIVRAAAEAGLRLGFTPQAGAASTDANLPINLGVPSLTIDGGGRGGGAHTLAEWFDTAESHVGTQWALLLALTLAGIR